MTEQLEKLQLPGIKHIIAIASGKGGVGKSTVATNLAAALVGQGLAVGLLDADIYGPSQGALLGVPPGTRPEVQGDLLLPVTRHGIKCMSMSLVASERTPAIWRGPMASGALQQLLTQCQWGELDLLLVDMPPGTGDIQLTLAQKVPLAGAVIVTTPQDIALLDARKGIEMFGKVAVPVLGIVENMATHICPACGHADAIFGEGGGAAVADDYGAQVIARLPLATNIRKTSDEGSPLVKVAPEDLASVEFIRAAAFIAEAVSSGVVPGTAVGSAVGTAIGAGAPVINILDD